MGKKPAASMLAVAVALMVGTSTCWAQYYDNWHNGGGGYGRRYYHPQRFQQRRGGDPEIDWKAAGVSPNDVQWICRNSKTQDMIVIAEESLRGGFPLRQPPQNNFRYPPSGDAPNMPGNQNSNGQLYFPSQPQPPKNQFPQESKDDLTFDPSFDEPSKPVWPDFGGNNKAPTQPTTPVPKQETLVTSPALVAQPTQPKKDDLDDDDTIEIVTG
ncbi:uncharacterized protein LOC106636491 isoform X2 [Copidosoma floridanum]|uniref:uncharacterized protein LOC106636491 isoform X2 n=1 Tax=Copidosoma floridanum TaxID=29053 RepID=UPI000C6F609C|nr:uncharacterized protein LOC106636491 isoform X2 [Copidosoma floridanum]